MYQGGERSDGRVNMTSRGGTGRNSTWLNSENCRDQKLLKGEKNVSVLVFKSAGDFLASTACRGGQSLPESFAHIRM